MEAKIEHRPSASWARLRMAAGEVVYVEPSSIATIKGPVEVSASLGGNGVMSSVIRRVADQTTFMTCLRVRQGAAEVTIAPPHFGDLAVLNLDKTGPLMAVSGSLLAYEQGVEVNTRVAAVRKLVLGSSAAVIKIEGSGKAILAALGAVEPVEVPPGQSFIVDSGHLIAWSADANMDLGPLKSVVSSAFTGEGLVGQFEGPCTVLVQTRQME